VRQAPARSPQRKSLYPPPPRSSGTGSGGAPPTSAGTPQPVTHARHIQQLEAGKAADRTVAGAAAVTATPQQSPNRRALFVGEEVGAGPMPITPRPAPTAPPAQQQHNADTAAAGPATQEAWHIPAVGQQSPLQPAAPRPAHAGPPSGGDPMVTGSGMEKKAGTAMRLSRREAWVKFMAYEVCGPPMGMSCCTHDLSIRRFIPSVVNMAIQSTLGKCNCTSSHPTSPRPS
jgi:hypothetical protein